MLFEVAMVEEPTKKAAEEEGKSERLVFGPKCICAASEQVAGLLAGKEADLSNANVDQLKVYIRPFVNPR